jgi:hypothetical protein
MRTIFLTYWALFFFLNQISAQLDRNWIFGIKESNQKTIVMKFNLDSIDFDTLNVQIPFESTTASISDASGNLLFFSNGCEIYNKFGEIILNGEQINPGEMHDWVCSTNGYNSPKGMTFLPFPNHPNQYFIIHSGMKYTDTHALTQGPLYFSILDGNENNGKGEMISKNNILFNKEIEPFSIVRHGNGRDWWILCPEANSNKYHLWLLNSYGISENPIQVIGPIFNCKRIGSTAFSPNGARFGRKANCETAIFKFDRCSGFLDFETSFSQPNYLFGGGGIAFSPDGNFLYSSGQLTILRADLSKTNPTLDTALVWNTQWGASLGLMEYTPFDQIMFGGMSRTPYYSLMTNPKFIGDSLGFQPKGIGLPSFHARSIPNFPNFKLGDLNGSICDTLGINAVLNLKNEMDFNLWPNPAFNSITFEVKTRHQGHFLFKIMNQLGQIKHTGEADFNQKMIINLVDFDSGLYFLQLFSEENQFFKTEKFSVLRK